MLTLGLFCPAYKALLMLVPSKGRAALPSLAQLLECWPMHQRVTGLVSDQGYLGCRFDPWCLLVTTN